METARASDEDLELVERLRRRDETAFMDLVDRLGPSLLRIARMYVSTNASAEECVQEAWLGVLRGIDRFEGRSSLRTWITRILVNIAKTRGAKEHRTVPFATLAGDDLEQPSFDLAMFQDATGQFPGHWSSLPNDWGSSPEERLTGAEVLGVVEGAIETLPPMQAEVIRLRDLLGWTSEEVRNALDISETNQRVLLHRARTKVRRAVDAYMDEA